MNTSGSGTGALDELFVEMEFDFQAAEKKRFDDYEKFVGETAIFPNDRGISYCVTKLCGEIGEVHDKISMIVLQSSAFSDNYFAHCLSKDDEKAIILELGDVLWYTTALSRQFGKSLHDLYCLEVEPDPGLEHPSDVSTLVYLNRLSAQAGNIAERSGKMIRDKGSDGTNTSYLSDPDYVDLVVMSLHHIVELIEAVAFNIGWETLSTVIEKNVEKLESRRARNVIKGDGDNR